jgi:hypothetical protein
MNELLNTLKKIAEHECLCCSGDCGCGFLFQQWAKAALKQSEPKSNRVADMDEDDQA